MRSLNYLLKGFGYENLTDFKRACFGIYVQGMKVDKIALASIAGGLRVVLIDFVGFDWYVFVAFVFLIAAEFRSGIKVARKVRKERFRSRPFGRMIVKIGVYVSIVSVLHQFATAVDAPDIVGVSMNPFVWLYYAILFGIIFQLMVSWFENLGQLGYKETGGLVGFLLRKGNAFFEFDGSKNNIDDDEKDNS